MDTHRAEPPTDQGPETRAPLLLHLHDPDLSDEELVLRALDNDSWARGAIYQRHSKQIANLALRLIGDRDEALDVVQDTFVTAFEKLPKLRDPTRLQAWLKMMAVRHTQRRFRRRRMLSRLGIGREPTHLCLAELASKDADQETLVQLGRAADILLKLPVRQRIVWSLRHVEGEALHSIAQWLNISLATVKRDLSAAQERVQHEVGGQS